MKESYEVIYIVFLYSEQLYGTIESLGAYASTVKYKKDDVEHEELFDNEDFIIMEEIVFTHIEE